MTILLKLNHKFLWKMRFQIRPRDGRLDRSGAEGGLQQWQAVPRADLQAEQPLGGPPNVKSSDVKTGLMLDLLQNSMQIFETEEMTKWLFCY